MIRLADRMDCTGCSACRSACPASCISMRQDAEGFLYPEIDAGRCVSCGLCVKACPELNPVSKKSPSAVFAAWAQDGEQRAASASGGVFYALGKKVIGDGGVVCGAILDEGGVRHICTDRLPELGKMRGSKYVQSRLDDCFREIAGYLKDGRNVFFSGTPCQVAGLRSCLGEGLQEHLLTAEIVCHGVPSKTLFDRYLDDLHGKYGPFPAASFRFRRTDCWTTDLSSTIVTEEGTRSLRRRDCAFMALYQSDWVFRESCYRCKHAGTERTADLTLGDFWGLKGTGVPESTLEAGCSLILVHTGKGRSFLESVSDSLFLQERAPAEAFRSNAGLSGPSPRPRIRTDIYRRVERQGLGSLRLLVACRKAFLPAYQALHHQLHLIKKALCRKSA